MHYCILLYLLLHIYPSILLYTDANGIYVLALLYFMSVCDIDMNEHVCLMVKSYSVCHMLSNLISDMYEQLN